MENVIKAIEERKLYDYVANNYYDMSKSELKDIILELAYAINQVGGFDIQKANDAWEFILEEVKDRWSDE